MLDTDGGVEVSRDEFCEVCERLGADAQRGLSLKQFIATYTDHPELEADIDKDYDLVFPFGYEYEQYLKNKKNVDDPMVGPPGQGRRIPDSWEDECLRG